MWVLRSVAAAADCAAPSSTASPSRRAASARLRRLRPSADDRVFLESGKCDMVRLGRRRRLRIELERQLQVRGFVTREGNRVDPRIARGAVVGTSAWDGAGQAVETQIREGVGVDILPDFFERVRGGDQLRATRRVDAVKAGRD